MTDTDLQARFLLAELVSLLADERRARRAELAPGQDRAQRRAHRAQRRAYRDARRAAEQAAYKLLTGREA